MTKFQLRRWWLQVHKWIGLSLAILIIPISLSGAALVWDEPVTRALEPQRYAVSGDAQLSPQAYAAAAVARLQPGERIAQLTLPRDGGPVTLTAAPAGQPSRAGPPPRTNIYLDPPTARVLDVAPSSAGLVRFLHVLHGSLQITNGWGRTIVGWIGIAMMLSSLTGLWLWWPTVGRWTRGLRWHRRGDTNSNLHHLFGFWIALPLFVLSFTGAWISFPKVFGALSGQASPRGPDRAMQARARPVERTALSVEVAVARAQALTPGPLRSITWPTEQKPDWTVQLGNGQPVAISVADDSGVAVPAPIQAGQGDTARLMRRIHDGTGMGPVWQAIIFLGGLLPAALAVTGVLMWWRARARSVRDRSVARVAERTAAGGL